MDVRHRFVDAAGRTGIGRDAPPRLTAVVRAIDAGAVAGGFDGREQPLRIARRDPDLGVDDAVGQALRQRLPRRAAVDRLEDAAVGAVPRRVFPRTLALLPQRRVDDVGVRRVDVDVLAAGVDVFEEHALERLPAVGRAEDAALFVRAVGMAERGDEQPIGVFRIDGDFRNLLRIAQAEMRPRLAGVRGLIDAVAN